MDDRERPAPDQSKPLGEHPAQQRAPQAELKPVHAAGGSPSELGPLLERLIREHESLLDATSRHRSAISAADPKLLEETLDVLAGAVRRVAELEHERQRMVTSMLDGLHEKLSPRPTLTELAELADPADRELLLERAGVLKGLMERCRREQAVVREASSSLLTHMQGLMKQVAARLSHAGTYGRGGAVEPGRQQIVTGIDVRR